MAVITIGHQKGGPGKTTGAINLAVLIQQMGYSVVLVDADPQKNAASWSEARVQNSKFDNIPCVEKSGNLRELLIDLNGRYNFVIVDAPGRDSRELRTALFASHVFLIPFRASQFDLETVLKVNEMIEDAKDQNPRLLALSYLNQVPTHAWNTEVKAALEMLSKHAKFLILKTKVCMRTAYRTTVVSGSAVVESKDKKAKRETQQLMHEILNCMEEEFKAYA